MRQFFHSIRANHPSKSHVHLFHAAESHPVPLQVFAYLPAFQTIRSNQRQAKTAWVYPATCASPEWHLGCSPEKFEFKDILKISRRPRSKLRILYARINYIESGVHRGNHFA